MTKTTNGEVTDLDSPPTNEDMADWPPNYRAMKNRAVNALRAGHRLPGTDSKIGSIIGDTFGRLRVEERAEPTPGDSHAKYVCLCDPELGGCGTVVEVYGTHLTTGNTRSCGCLHDESKSLWGRNSVIHRSTYVTWYSKKRFKTFSPEWAADFGKFLDDMGPRPEGARLERIDKKQRYQKGNCRWSGQHTEVNAAASSPDQNASCQPKRKTLRLKSLDGSAKGGSGGLADPAGVRG